MFCTNCGKEVLEGISFCSYCGHAVISIEHHAEQGEENGMLKESSFDKKYNEVPRKEYDLLDSKLRISEAYLEYISVYKSYELKIRELGGECAKEILDNAPGSLSELPWYFSDLGKKYTDKMIDSCMELLIENKIYTVKKEELYSYIWDDPQDMEWKNTIKEIHWSLNKIDNASYAAKKKREQRRRARTRFAGGGFGIRGAISGAIQASILNTGIDLAHATVNAIGNTATNIRADKKKQDLLENGNYKRSFVGDLYSTFYDALEGTFEFVNEKLGKIKYELISKEHEDKAYTIQENICNDNIKGDERKTFFIQAMETDPSNIDLFGWMLYYYPEESGNLRLILNDLQWEYKEVIQVMLNECYQEKIMDMVMNLKKYYEITQGTISVAQIEQMQKDVAASKKYLGEILPQYNLAEDELEYIYKVFGFDMYHEKLIEYHMMISDLVMRKDNIAFGETHSVSDITELISEREKQEKVKKIFKAISWSEIEKVKEAYDEIKSIDSFGWAKQVLLYLKNIIVPFGDGRIEVLEDAVTIKKAIDLNRLENLDDYESAIEKIDSLDIMVKSRDAAKKVVLHAETLFINKQIEYVSNQIDMASDMSVQEFIDNVEFLNRVRGKAEEGRIRNLESRLLQAEKSHNVRFSTIFAALIIVIVLIIGKGILLSAMANFPSIVLKIIDIGGWILIGFAVLGGTLGIIQAKSWMRSSKEARKILHANLITK